MTNLQILNNVNKIILQWLSVWFRQKDAFQSLIFDKLISKLPIDKQTGWDETKDISVSKQLVRHIRIFVDDYLKSINRASFFSKI